MRFSSSLLTLAALGLAACGPTYVVQSPPHPVPERVPVPAPVPAPAPEPVQPLQVNIVRPDDGRVLIQTNRPAYVAVFEIVPGRGVSLVYPAPYHPRDVMLTGLNWVNVDWTMRFDDRRYASDETRYIYAVASDTPLRINDQDYDREYLQRQLGGAYWSSSPNSTVRSISREFVRPQPDEWWGEDMYSMPMLAPRVTVTVRLARVYCPGGVYFDVRDELAGAVWCPGRAARPGERPVTVLPDSVFASTGRRMPPRRIDPSVRTPVFRVPATTDVQQQGHPDGPRYPAPNPPRSYPQNPQLPAANQPPQNQPPQSQPPRYQPPQTQPGTPPQNQPGQTQPQDSGGNDQAHGNNGRRAHGDPRNADPRGNGNGYGNGGREQPATQAPASNPPASNPAQSNPGSQHGQQQGQPQSQVNGQQNHGNSNPGNSGNNGNGASNGNGKGAAAAQPGHSDSPKSGLSSLLEKRGPQAARKQDDKKAASDSTDKKKPNE